MYGTWQSTPNKALTFLTCVMLIMSKKKSIFKHHRHSLGKRKLFRQLVSVGKKLKGLFNFSCFVLMESCKGTLKRQANSEQKWKVLFCRCFL